MTGTPRLSVVVPTHERRELVVATVRALERQREAPPFEVIVVVDGSRDGTAAALAALSPSFPLRVLEQENRGAAAARQRGAEAARGEVLLFLDDDMEADPRLLAEHDRRQRAGDEVVLGDLPLHRDSPDHRLARRVGAWAAARRSRLGAAGARVPGRELRTGQLSISRRLFERVGGFDLDFTRGGRFGGEDVELGLRLERAGAGIVFEPQAVSHQRYAVSWRAHLARQRDVGRSEVALERKHPSPAGHRPTWREPARDRWLGRWLWPLLRPPIVAALEAGARGELLERVFDRLAAFEYGRGVREAGGFPDGDEVRVLAYHAVRDLAGARRIAQYGVPGDELRRQLRALVRRGFRFVAVDELLRLLGDGSPVPRRALLLTFDDAYLDQRREALPIVRELGIPAVVFVPTAHVGGRNAWDARFGAPELPLCGAAELAELRAAGVELGSHGRTHRPLAGLDEAELATELDGSAAELARLGLGRPRLLSYPHGVHDATVRAAAAACGYQAAFTVEPGRIRRGSGALALPRVEVFRRDGARGLLAKLRQASAPPLTPP
jgi:glycosyltransferase involved in cell wall biosynthesis/peptidoglycan/xylan/chitin deacetylase (PgdA/CDA1 family)